MAYGIIEDGGGVRTSQPQQPVGVNWANPYSRGLIAGIVGGHPVDLVQRSPLVISNVTTTTGSKGKNFTLPSSTYAYVDSNNPGISVSVGAKWSALLLVRSTGKNSRAPHAVCVNYNGSSVALALCTETNSSGNGASFYDGAWRASGTSTVITGDNLWHVIVGVRDGPLLSYYIDGKLDSSATVVEIGAATSTTAITWGLYKNDNLDTCFIGDIALGAVWAGVALNAGNVQSLSNNPWQLFEPDNDPVFYSMAAGGTVTGVGSSAGVGAASGVGASTSAQVGSSAGVGAASGVGASTADSVGSSSGTGAADGVGSSTGGSDGVGASTGTSTASGIGASTAASTGSSDGVGTGTGVGASTAASTGSASGTGEALGVGTNGSVVVTGVGSASGTGTATGIAPIVSAGGGKTFGSNKKKKKQRKAIESEEWLKAEETAKQLLQDRFTKTTPEAKLEALASHIESLQPVIDALKALATADVQEPVQETRTEELTEHQQVLNKFDALITKMASIEELLIIMMAQ